MKSCLILAGLALASCAPAEPDIAVTDGWARATARGMSSAALYLTVANRGEGEDRLVGAAVAGARAASLHTSSMDGGVMRMRPLDEGIAIPPGETLTLAPGAIHIMATGLGAPLTPGAMVETRLRFERSGERIVPIKVVAAGAR